MSDDPDAALASLRRLVGTSQAQFHPGQRQAIETILSGGRRALVVQRTGWGKSAVYFVATALRRADGAGPTLLVSPLLALMRDQVAAAQRAGIRAMTMNSANAAQWEEVAQALRDDAVDILLVSPERLNNPGFRETQLPALRARLGLLVIDEAHCISDWGHDFRPDYRRIRDVLSELDENVPVLATTATANARVVADVQEQLTGSTPEGATHEVVTIRGELARSSLRLGVLARMTPEQRIGWLAHHLPSLLGSGIIYTLTVSAAEDISLALREAGHQVSAYTGRTDPADRERMEDDLRENRVKALVATSALGMGFDKPDLGFVVHVGAPSSPVAYYQQVGRAGRATDRADVLLMPGHEDKEIWAYFASASMPRRDQADAVLAALIGARSPMSVAALETAVDVRRTRLELLLKVLDVDGAVSRVRGGWVATGQPWTYDEDRYARVRQAREREQDLMLEYESTAECRMAFLQRALDDAAAAPCGRCDRCVGVWFSTEVPAQAAQAAQAALHRPGVKIEPRAQWPTGMDRLGVDAKGRISPELQVQPGRAVARLTDLGWGNRLREFFSGPDAEVPDELTRAVIAVLTAWDWQRRPASVVALPSRSRPRTVESLARGIATVGRLDFLGTLELLDGGPVGQRGGNSAYRLAGVWQRLAVGPDLAAAIAATSEPILLVDDLVDSRWTFTVAGATVRAAGAAAVMPLALASVG